MNQFDWATTFQKIGQLSLNCSTNESNANSQNGTNHLHDIHVAANLQPNSQQIISREFSNHSSNFALNCVPSEYQQSESRNSNQLPITGNSHRLYTFMDENSLQSQTKIQKYSKNRERINSQRADISKSVSNLGILELIEESRKKREKFLNKIVSPSVRLNSITPKGHFHALANKTPKCKSFSKNSILDLQKSKKCKTPREFEQEKKLFRARSSIGALKSDRSIKQHKISKLDLEDRLPTFCKNTLQEKNQREIDHTDSIELLLKKKKQLEKQLLSINNNILLKKKKKGTQTKSKAQIDMVKKKGSGAVSKNYYRF